jgi:hypothetical protein
MLNKPNFWSTNLISGTECLQLICVYVTDIYQNRCLQAYNKALGILSRLLGLRSKVTAKDLCVQFG